MKACGRTLKSTMAKCGTLFDGPGAYCRECRNEYQREHYKKRKGDHYLANTEKTGASCQACSTALRSNTVARIDEVGMQQTVVLCETCKAVVTYLSETIDESAMEFIVDLAAELAQLKYGEGSESTRPHSAAASNYGAVPANQSLFRECGSCSRAARPGKTFCEDHDEFEESFYNSYAARMERGEL